MMKIIEGTCKGCGQVQNVNVGDLEGMNPAQIQEIADERATANCGCPEGREIAAWEKTKETIRAMCGIESLRAGFEEISEETELELIKTARMVFDGLVDKITVNVNASQIVMTSTENGAKITRKANIEFFG